MTGWLKRYIDDARLYLKEKESVEAYNIWSNNYDNQVGNLMLDTDEVLFTRLLSDIDLENKRVFDMGCGTGRHWKKIYEKAPASVTGFDVSQGMLAQLQKKFPQADTRLITDNFLTDIPDKSVDCIVSTLTIAHIKNIEETIAEWSRILASTGNLIITDFHPDILAIGGKRSFTVDNQKYSVINYVHPLNNFIRLLYQNGLSVIRKEEICIDQNVRHYYESQNALQTYNRFTGKSFIYGLLLNKQYAAQ